MSDFEISPKGPFSLATTRDFLAGFPPSVASWGGSDGRLRMAFALDRSFRPAGVSLTEEDGLIRGTVFGTTDVDAVRRQVSRILSLDVDARGYQEMGVHDPTIGRIQAEFPGLRHVCFPSPYEAAAWGILSQRIQMTQAARLKTRILEALVEPLAIDGEDIRAFPPPERLLELGSVPGLPAEKLERLHAVARAAADGLLDAEHLASMPTDAAVAELSTVHGVGGWTASLILLRGLGPADELPLNEPRVRRAVALAYRLPEPPDDEAFLRIAQGWRPYRMWVAFLLRVWLGRASAEGP